MLLAWQISVFSPTDHEPTLFATIKGINARGVIELYLGSRGRLGDAVLRLREQHPHIRAEVG